MAVFCEELPPKRFSLDLPESSVPKKKKKKGETKERREEGHTHTHPSVHELIGCVNCWTQADFLLSEDPGTSCDFGVWHLRVEFLRENGWGGTRRDRGCSFLLRLPPSILGKLSSGKEGEKETALRSIAAMLNPLQK